MRCFGVSTSLDTNGWWSDLARYNACPAANPLAQAHWKL
jgi:hypothetical protein